MTHIRESLLKSLSRRPEGANLRVLREDADLNPDPENEAFVEALLMLSPECIRQADGWVLAAGNRGRRIMAELRRYSDATGKRIFRASSALSALPVQDQPTIDELSDILQTGDDEFELMPNGMIKRVNRT